MASQIINSNDGNINIQIAELIINDDKIDRLVENLYFINLLLNDFNQKQALPVLEKILNSANTLPISVCRDQIIIDCLKMLCKIHISIGHNRLIAAHHIEYLFNMCERRRDFITGLQALHYLAINEYNKLLTTKNPNIIYNEVLRKYKRIFDFYNNKLNKSDLLNNPLIKNRWTDIRFCFGAVLSYGKRFNQALDFTRGALIHSYETDDNLLIFNNLVHLGNAYSGLNCLDESLAAFSEADSMSGAITGMPLVIFLKYYATVLHKTMNDSEFLKNIQKASDLAISIGATDQIRHIRLIGGVNK